jgi:hypothetical protein
MTVGCGEHDDIAVILATLHRKVSIEGLDVDKTMRGISNQKAAREIVA